MLFRSLGIAGGFFPVVTPEIGAFVAALAAKAVELLKPQQVIVNADSVVVEFGRTEGGGAP